MNGIVCFANTFPQDRVIARLLMVWVGTGGWEPGRREGGKQESRGSRNREKLRKFCNILLYFGKKREVGVKGMGSGS